MSTCECCDRLIDPSDDSPFCPMHNHVTARRDGTAEHDRSAEEAYHAF